MRTFKGTISTNRINSEDTFEFEVEDDATDDEIEDEARQAMLERVNWDYEEDKD